jgi:hypothetical protein
MMRTFNKRVARLEQWLTPEPERLNLIRYEGPGSEHFPQPTPEQLAKARSVVTLVFVPAKDGRPATPEEIARGDTSDGQMIVDTRKDAPEWHDLA